MKQSNYICSHCQHPYTKYFGRCVMCGRWDTIEENEYPEPIKKKVKRRSIKGIKRHQSKVEVYKEIETKAFNEDNYICWGCGKNCGQISNSHLIPISKRQDLECEIHNIWLMGYGNSNSCHDLWETHNIKEIRKIPNYKKCLEVVKDLDSNYYYKLLIEK